MKKSILARYRKMDPPQLDQQFVEKVVQEVKSQGVFDEFRKDSVADVDTKPGYQSLRQSVENYAKVFLSKQFWTPEMNKNQLRERLRRHITELNFLDVGVERIVDQVVNSKIAIVFRPRIEKIAYQCMGISPPQVKNDSTPLIHALPLFPLNGTPLWVQTADLLPTNLKQVSPDSDKIAEKSNGYDDMDIEEINYDEDIPSPAFEPLGECSSIDELDAEEAYYAYLGTDDVYTEQSPQREKKEERRSSSPYSRSHSKEKRRFHEKDDRGRKSSRDRDSRSNYYSSSSKYSSSTKNMSHRSDDGENKSTKRSYYTSSYSSSRSGHESTRDNRKSEDRSRSASRNKDEHGRRSCAPNDDHNESRKDKSSDRGHGGVASKSTHKASSSASKNSSSHTKVTSKTSGDSKSHAKNDATEQTEDNGKVVILSNILVRPATNFIK